MIAEIQGDIEGALGLEDLGEVEKRGICKIQQFNRWSSRLRTHFEGSIFGGSWLGCYASVRHSDDFRMP